MTNQLKIPDAPIDDGTPVPAVLQSEDTQFLAMLERVATTPGINVENMQALLAMKMQMMAKGAEMKFNEAMARLQQKLPTIDKKGMIEFVDKNNVTRKTPFAKYEDIDAAIRPHMLAEGFTITFDSVWGAEGATVTGILSHKDGHSKQATIRLPLDSSGSKNSLQGMGSTLSYARRYLVGMLLNIVTKNEDNDGAGDSMEPLTTEQIKRLRDMIEENGFDTQAFLKMMGAETLALIPQRDFPKAVSALLIKKKAKANA